MSTNPRSRAWVEVDAGALRRNLARLISSAPRGTALVPMIKADAYGLGALQTVHALTSGEAPVRPWAWGVATVGEGEALRRAGIVDDIQVYSPLTPDELPAAHAAGLTPTLSLPADLSRWLEVAQSMPARPAPHRTASFQIEIDTGMGRAGAPESTWSEWRRALDAAGMRAPAPAPAPATWVGIFTHCHSADEPQAPGMAEQMSRFQAACATLAPPARVRAHVANSAAALRLAAPTDVEPGAIRAGLFMYGGPLGPDLPQPEAVVRLCARVSRIVEVPAGTTCGYGATHRARGPERWATLSIGYGDGLPRLLGNRGAVLIAGRRVPIVGRISMDVTVANISDVDGVALGAVATLIGRDGTQDIPVQQVAEQAQTIPYEIFTRLGARLPRLWQGLDDLEPGAR